MLSTIARLTSRGAARPGISAVVITRSWPAMCLATISACSFLSSSESSLA
jgi:hypothetical protein